MGARMSVFLRIAPPYVPGCDLLKPAAITGTQPWQPSSAREPRCATSVVNRWSLSHTVAEERTAPHASLTADVAVAAAAAGTKRAENESTASSAQPDRKNPARNAEITPSSGMRIVR